MPDIVSIGECFIELYTPEPLHAEAKWELVYSGDTFNVLAMANRLGSSCGYITRVSDDPLGDFLLREWRGSGIDTSRARQTRGFNAIEFSSSVPRGEGSKVVFRRGSVASGMTRDDIDLEYIADAKVLHVSGITQGISRSCRDAVLYAVRTAAERGVFVSYDTNLRLNLWSSPSEAREAMEEALPYVDLVAPSFPHEPKALLGLDDELEVIDWFLSRGVEAVALKCGADGAWVATSDVTARLPAVAPRGLLHASGAGDTFVGGLLHALAKGEDIVEGARLAAACAGLKVGGPSIKALPTLAEALAILPDVESEIIRGRAVESAPAPQRTQSAE